MGGEGKGKREYLLVIAFQNLREGLRGRFSFLPARIRHDSCHRIRIKKEFLACGAVYDRFGREAHRLHDAQQLLRLVLSREKWVTT